MQNQYKITLKTRLFWGGKLRRCGCNHTHTSVIARAQGTSCHRRHRLLTAAACSGRCCGGCRCEAAKELAAMLPARPTCAPLLGRTIADVIAPSPLSLRMMAARQRMHVACVRRAAAAYGNGCERYFGCSHLNSGSNIVGEGLSSRLTWHDFVISRFRTFPHSPSLGYRSV